MNEEITSQKTMVMNAAPEVSARSSAPVVMTEQLTIKQARECYRNLRRCATTPLESIILQLIDKSIRTEFQNDSYLDALLLTEAMLASAGKHIVWLSGGSADGFLAELSSAFESALSRIQKAGGSVRLVLLCNQMPPILIPMLKKYSALKVALAKSEKPLQHFIVCDSKAVRVEEVHGDLSDESLASDVKATVYFNNPTKASFWEVFFNAVWTNVHPA
jgi:hypothetical protein